MKFNEDIEDYREQLLETLADMRDQHFIVEGKRDVEALGLVGIVDVHYLKGKGLYEFAESLDERQKYVILTDFDPTGERLAREIARHMKHLGIVYDVLKRKKLRTLFIKSNIATIQGVRNLV